MRLGGIDNGASYGFIDEDDINLSVAFYLDYELRLCLLGATTSFSPGQTNITTRGITTVLTRERDEYVSLYRRSALANIEKPDLFVSIHCDAWHNVTTSGMTIHVHPNASLNSRLAAKQIENQLKTQFPDHLYRGIKESNFHVLRETKCPAILCEIEFLSCQNPSIREFLKEAENQRRMARALKLGIVNYLQELKNENKKL